MLVRDAALLVMVLGIESSKLAGMMGDVESSIYQAREGTRQLTW